MSGAQASAAPIHAESAPLTRKRAIAVWTLVVVASILLLLSLAHGLGEAAGPRHGRVDERVRADARE